jgi:hypothetical protein
VTEIEEVNVEQAPEEGNPLVEVGFDICGTSEEPNYPVNQGKPQMHLNPSLHFTNLISLMLWYVTLGD